MQQNLYNIKVYKNSCLLNLLQVAIFQKITSHVTKKRMHQWVNLVNLTSFQLPY